MQRSTKFVLLLIACVVASFVAGILVDGVDGSNDYIGPSLSSDTQNIIMFRENDEYFFNDLISNCSILSISKDTESMAPSLTIDDIVFVTYNFTDEDIRVGNIALFVPKDTDITIAHRIIRIEGNKIYTKGDNNNYVDEGYITREDIVAIVIGVIYQ